MHATVTQHLLRLYYRLRFFLHYNQHLHRAVLITATVAIVAVLWIGGATTGAMLARDAVQVRTQTADHPYDSPITITFSRPIKPGVRYEWRAPVKGKWYEKAEYGFVRVLVFMPERLLPPGALLELDIRGIEPAVDASSGTKPNQTLSFHVQPAPTLQSITPQTGAKDISVDTDFTVTFSSPNRTLRRLVLDGNIPVASVEPTTKDDKTFTWKLAEPLGQGRHYSAKVLDAVQPAGGQEVAHFDFTTVVEPQVSATHAGLLYPGQKLDLIFDVDMAQVGSAVKFDIAGSGVWLSPRKYSYTPTDFTPGKSWGYRVLAGAKTSVGGAMSANREFYVSTPGAVQIMYAVPTGNHVRPDMRVAVTFDRPVNHASAEAAFGISPHVPGTFTWSNNSMVYMHTGLQPQTRYTVTVAPGVRPVYGLPSTGYSMSFLTTQ